MKTESPTEVNKNENTEQPRSAYVEGLCVFQSKERAGHSVEAVKI